MATIDSRGLVNDGTANLNVAGNEVINGTCSTGANMMISNALTSSGNVQLAGSGFFTVAATAGFTGSLPAPASWPGADLMIVETANNFNILLTGSMAIMSTVGSTVTSTAGTKLALTKGCSVVMASDTVKWVICAVNGTGSLSP